MAFACKARLRIRARAGHQHDQRQGSEQNRLLVQMYKNLNDELPALPLYLNFQVIAHSANLQGPTSYFSMTSTTRYRNLHEWQWIN